MDFHYVFTVKIDRRVPSHPATSYQARQAALLFSPAPFPFLPSPWPDSPLPLPRLYFRRKIVILDERCLIFEKLVTNVSAAPTGWLGECAKLDGCTKIIKKL